MTRLTAIRPPVKRKELKLDLPNLKIAALTLRAINHKLRQKILLFIHQRGKINVTEIYVRLHLEQSVTSQHLAVLRKCGFVLSERDGQTIYYSVNYDRIGQVQFHAKEMIK